MSDLTLQTTLTADAGPLNAALKGGAQSVAQYSAAAQQASTAQTAATNAGRVALGAHQAAMRSATAEANNLKQAYRQLPMQITDVTTSLASGMPIWMVAIQQGGQIRDSFGGMRPAMQGVLSLLTPMRLGMMGLAGAAAAVALAYKQGSSEADAYRQAIVMSGNAAGVTMGQIAGMARAVSQTRAGSESQAAAALAQAAATGRVTADNLQMVATTALQMKDATGAAVEDTVAQFAALGKEPVAASRRLNEQYNYLTISVYEQIKALEKRGEIEAAADLAQKTFGAAMKTRTDELLANLGSIERAWLEVKKTAAAAWSDMLGIGRQDTNEEKLKRVQAQLAELAKAGQKGYVFGPSADELRQQAATLQLLVDGAAKVARMDAAAAAATTKHLATEKDREAAIKASAEAYAKLKDEIAGRIAQANAELANGGALSDAQKLELDLKAKITEASGKLGAAKAAELRADAAAAATALRRLQAQQDLTAAQAQAREAAFKAGEAAQREADTLDKSNESLRQEIESLGLTGYALVAVEQARLSSAIAIKEEELARLDSLKTNTMEQDALQRQIAALKERRALLGQREIKRVDQGIEQAMDQQRRAEAEENARRSDALGKSISQGILQGARDGRGIMDTFRKELEDAFERTVLRPMIQPFANETNNMIGGAFSAAGGLGGLFDLSGSGGKGIWDFLSGIFVHGGGVIGTDRPHSTRQLPASLWAGAPRYHKGMLGTDEVPAVLQKGESVLTPGQLKAVAGAGASQVLNLTVINATGQPAQATAKRKSDGGIEVMLTAIENAMAGNVANGSGPLTGALRQRFGLRDSFNGA